LPEHRTTSSDAGGAASAPPAASGGAGVVSSVVGSLAASRGVGSILTRLCGSGAVPDGTPPDLPLERPD
jgi:hypothetical protein